MIIVKGVESDQLLSENLVRFTSRRSTDEIQYLRCNFLRWNSHSVVKLSLRYGYATYHKLRVHLGKQNLCSIRPEGG